jgi:hypothetical protein
VKSMTRNPLALAAIVAVTMCSFALVAVAADQTTGHVPTGYKSASLHIGATVISCTSNNIPVIWVANNELNDVGMTIPSGTWTSIVYNPEALNMLPDRIKMFWLGHECGHAFLRTSDELRADCWSATTGVRQHWFNASDADELAKEMYNNHGDRTHPPGQVRSKHVRDCVVNGDSSTAGSPANETPLQRCQQPPAPKERRSELRSDLEFAERQVRSAQESEARHRADAEEDERRAERALARGDRGDVRMWRDSAEKSRQYANTDHRWYLENVGKVASLKCALREN